MPVAPPAIHQPPAGEPDTPSGVFAPLAGAAARPQGVHVPLGMSRMGVLAAAMRREILSRTAGKTAASALHLFSGLSHQVTSLPATLTPNAALWCEDLRPQLTGVHMGAQDWAQSYGLQAITPRHAISCGHNGPPVGKTLKYVAADGTVFTTSILKWINDYPNVASSDTKGPFVTDLSVYLLADALPAWAYKAPVAKLSSAELSELASLNPPTLAVSQGNWTTGPSDANTPNNRKAYTKNLALGAVAGAAEFFHNVQVGDSGTPEFIAADGTLYLHRIITASGGGGIIVPQHTDYLNALIARADASAGISTGHQLDVRDLPARL